MGMKETFERGLASLMSLMKMRVGDYCDLESVEMDDDGYGSLIAKDGSMATVVKYEGIKTMMSRADFVDAITAFGISAQAYLGTKGHQVQVVFDRNDDPTPEMEHWLAPSYATAQRLQLDVKEILDEGQRVLARWCSSESIYFVIWTRPSLLAPIEAKLYAQELAQYAKRVPPMKEAQNPLRTIRFLVDRHNATTAKFVQDLAAMKGSAHVVPVKEALRIVRDSLFHDVTPPDWEPTVIGDPVYTRWQRKPVGKDVSAAMPQPLRDQLMPLDANIGQANGDGGVTDTRAVRIGSRLYAPCFVSQFPMSVTIFESLFRDLNNATTQTKFGVKPMPWRLSFMIEGDGLSGKALGKIFAGVLGLTSESNRNLVRSLNALSNYQSSGGSVVKVQINAMTWVDFGDEKELMLRRSKLVRTLTAWGNANVNEETGDPAQGAVNCAVGLSYKSIAPATAVPLEDILSILPFGRPASAFDNGHSLFRSMDGKLLRYEMFSAKQPTWITLVFAGPGSGKSVLVNRLNTEMCYSGGLTKLPFICVIDIGVSSSGFISLIRESLPENQKHLCMYTRLQNTPDYTINPFDTMLGCRKPLERERDYMKNFLTMLATSPGSKPDEGMDPFCGIVVDAMFKALSDLNERSSPREYTHESDEVVTREVERLGIEWSVNTTWWNIVDGLFAKGSIHAAYRAQRYAMPTLTDAVRVASDENVTREYSKFGHSGVSVAEKFKLMISTAINDYPIFASQTAFDMGETRLMAIDLNDVVTTGSAAAKKKAALMYMTARNLFIKKIAISEEDLPYVPDAYRDYHNERYNEIKEVQKRLVYDEYHKTGGDPMLEEQAQTDGREGRKWGLEVMLASQLPEDFKSMSKLATTVFVLDAGTPQTRKEIQETFGLSPAEMSALVNYVHGPQAEGATFLALFSTSESRMSQLLTSTMSPQMLWGLATGQEDRVIRDWLYRALGPVEARKALAWRFPGGSARKFVQKKRATYQDQGDDGWLDEDQQTSMLVKIAEEVRDQWLMRNVDVPAKLAG